VDNSHVSSDQTETVNRHAFRILGGVVVAMLFGATLAYHSIEGWSWVDSFYFSTVAVTTVGFGDLAPSTDASKLFTCFYVLSGIGIITTYVNLRFRMSTQKYNRRRRTS